MPGFVTYGRVRGRKILVDDKCSYDLALEKLEGSEVVVRIEARRATRSLQANAYYWGVIVQLISEHTGYSPDEVHEILKARFIPKRIAIADRNGEVRDELVIGGTTTTLDTAEFHEFCESIRRWAAEDLGVVIPDPLERTA